MTSLNYQKGFRLSLYIATLIFIITQQQLSSQNLTNSIQQIQQDHDLMGGVVVVFCKDQILQTIPFGTADYQRSIPVSDSSMFRIASISKTITAIAVMQLYEDGLLNLDTDIGNILGYQVRNPNFSSTPITVRMLLSHTSTINDGSTYSNFLSATYNDNPIPDLNELLTPGGSYYTSAQFSNLQPGSYFNYSNVNYGILGTIIEKISGLRFDVYCKQNILDPLDIIGSYNVNHINNIDNIAVLYRKNGGVWTAQADNYQGTQPVFTNLSGYIPGTNGFRFAPQGGLRISGNDLSKIFMSLLNHGMYGAYPLLDSSSVSEMLNPEWIYTGTNGNNYYGLFRSWGLGIHRTTNTVNNDIVLPGSSQMLGHPGEAYGLISDAYIDTLRQVGIVFITNGCGEGYTTNSSSAYYTVETDIFQAIETYGEPGSCITISVQEIIPDSPYEVFPNPFSDEIVISIKDERDFHHIRIFDHTGRLIMETNFFGPTGNIQTENLATGLWLLDIDNIYRVMIIKQ
jgi:CubicO group peptidase (beta-lactamase class C family)